jgi:glycosyltransferase involved in cell wall biosynthesis
MSDLPFTSVVVAAYNSERTIARCLAALAALDYPRFEVIVVDNASTDRTRQLVAERAGEGAADKPPLTLLDEPRRGWPAARNRAWHFSRAPLVANIDADCFAEPSWLRELVAALLADRSAGVAVGRTKVEPGTTLAQRFYAGGDPFNIEANMDPARVDTPPWGGGNNAVRREVIAAVGGYDAATYTSGADREFHRRFESRTPYHTIYVPRAVIWHAPRGSAREFFAQAARFAADAVVHAEFDAGVAARIRGATRRHLAQLARHAAALVLRSARFLVRRETALRVAQPFYWGVQSLGALWGHWRGRRRLRRLRRERRPSRATAAHTRTPEERHDTSP